MGNVVRDRRLGKQGSGRGSAEDLSMRAYDHAHLDPCDPDVGTGLILLSMVRVGGVNLVDVGPQAGRALVDFGASRRSGHFYDLPIRVHILRRQRCEELTMACARAVAQILAWSVCQVWTEDDLEAVALSVAMPMPTVRDALNEGSYDDVAWTFCVDEDDVARRDRMLRPDLPTNTIDFADAKRRIRVRRTRKP